MRRNRRVYCKSYIYRFCRLCDTIGQSLGKYFLYTFKSVSWNSESYSTKEAVNTLVTSSAQEPIQEVIGAEVLNNSAHSVISTVSEELFRGPRNDTDP